METNPESEEHSETSAEQAENTEEKSEKVADSPPEIQVSEEVKVESTEKEEESEKAKKDVEEQKAEESDTSKKDVEEQKEEEDKQENTQTEENPPQEKENPSEENKSIEKEAPDQVEEKKEPESQSTQESQETTAKAEPPQESVVKDVVTPIPTEEQSTPTKEETKNEAEEAKSTLLKQDAKPEPPQESAVKDVVTTIPAQEESTPQKEETKNDVEEAKSTPTKEEAKNDTEEVKEVSAEEYYKQASPPPSQPKRTSNLFGSVIDRPEEWGMNKKKAANAAAVIPVIEEESKEPEKGEKTEEEVRPELVEIQKVLDDALAEPPPTYPPAVYDVPQAKDFENEIKRNEISAPSFEPIDSQQGFTGYNKEIDTGVEAEKPEEFKTQYISTKLVDDEAQPEIYLRNPTIKQSAVSKHVVYSVIGKDSLSEYESTRRYNDFINLRTQLVKNWPACFVPAAPPKKKMGNINPYFVEQRRVLLEEFLQKISCIKYQYEADEFQLFIRGNQDFPKKFEAKKYDVEEIYSRFASTFPTYVSQDQSGTSFVEIATFSGFCNGIYERLRKIKYGVKEVQKKFDMFIVAYQKVDESIWDYEANVMNEYGQSTYSPIFTDMVKFSGANPYNPMYNWIKME